MNNLAFIDGQNLYIGTKISDPSWKIDLLKFRIYLKDKYKVSTAYYFIGNYQEKNENLYRSIRNYGYVLKFKQHTDALIGKKKGNVDSDIVFYIMKSFLLKEKFDKIVLISGDGDYKLVVDFLIKYDILYKIVFPNRKFASSLYKEINVGYKIFLDDNGIKNKIERKITKSR
jgi:uncharacterized LabA/DUF88 family protein